MGNADNIYDDLLEELRNAFVDEADDNLSSVEALLEELRIGEADPVEAVNRVLRPAHSLKGSSSVADFPLITIIMHRLEDYMNGIEKIEPRYFDDIQTFIDKAREYSVAEFDQQSISAAELSRQLPDRHDLESRDHRYEDHRVIEAMLVMREKTASLIFERELRAAWLRVNRVISSFSAIEMAVRTHPDIIICSGVIDMLGGVDIACALRAMPATKDIPVCLLTSFDKDHHDLADLPDDVYLIQKSNMKEDLHRILKKYDLISTQPKTNNASTLS